MISMVMFHGFLYVYQRISWNIHTERGYFWERRIFVVTQM